jgi:hypothetical protein
LSWWWWHKHSQSDLDAVGDGAHDLRRVRAGLVGVVVAEQHRVVVVAAELAEHEQGVGQVALAVCIFMRHAQSTARRQVRNRGASCSEKVKQQFFFFFFF